MTDNPTTAAIRAALDKLDHTTRYGTNQEWQTVKAEWTAESSTYVRYLLAENERLTAIAQAGEEAIGYVNTADVLADFGENAVQAIIAFKDALDKLAAADRDCGDRVGGC